MPYPLLSGFGAAGIRSRAGGRGVPAYGGHRNFAGVIPSRRSLFLPGSNWLSHASGMTSASGLFNNGTNQYSALSLMAWWHIPATVTPVATMGIACASTIVTSNGFGLLVSTASTVRFWAGGSHATAANNATSANLTDMVGTWHFSLGTWDAGAGATTMRLFVDGGTSEVDTGTLAVAQTFPNAPLELGRATSGSVTAAQYFQGYVADVAIWNRALTSGEATLLYNSGNPFDIDTDSGLLSGLLGWWRPGNARGEYQGIPHVLDLSSGNRDMLRNSGGPVDLVGPYPVIFAP